MCRRLRMSSTNFFKKGGGTGGWEGSEGRGGVKKKITIFAKKITEIKI